MRTALTLAIFVAAAGLGGCMPKTERIASVPQDLSAWPALPATGFIAGRAATKRDVNEGNAVFAAEHQGRVVGQPLSLEIPQYALHVDAESGVQKRVIVVQAERAGGKEMVGYRTLSGTEGVGTLPEFKLLGRRPGGE